MKTAYIKPAIVVTNIDSHDLMSASPGSGYDNTLNGSEKVNNSGDILSKRYKTYSVWDDDEE